jgi:hypothetical protein
MSGDARVLGLVLLPEAIGTDRAYPLGYRLPVGHNGPVDNAMARMRNRLVHHYEDIEPARVHELLRTRLSDFDLFARSIAEYLD